MCRYLTRLKEAKSLRDFAKIIGYTPRRVSYILYKIPFKERYTTFEIPKKNGGTRVIQAPEKKLKTLQKKVADLLETCWNELEQKHKRGKLAHGFKRECSIHTNAKLHKGKRYVLNFDIKDFFPSIHFGRIKGYFIKNRDFELSEEVAELIAKIACNKQEGNKLPQGSPCSPIISNLIAHLLDVRLVKIAKKYRLVYSRYADDITLSTNQKSFPTKIAFKDSEHSETWKLGDIVEKEVLACGFAIHPEKTRMRYKDTRQTVTGLVVNRKVNVRSEYYKRARAMTHSLFTKGEYFIPSKISPVDIEEKSNVPGQKEPEEKWNRLEGILRYIYYTKNWMDILSIEKEMNKQKKQSQKKVKEMQDAINEKTITKLLTEFLFLKSFVMPNKPVIICEGSTDTQYIKQVLKALAKNESVEKAKQYHFLIQKLENSENFKFHIQFFGEHSKGRHGSKNLLGFTGGTGPLSYFVNTYKNSLKKYPAWKNPPHPVIILIDNDDGAKIIGKFNEKIKQNILQETKAKNNKKNDKEEFIKNDKEFFHIYSNLYLIKTPHIGKKESTCIEDLLDQEWLKNKKWLGKVFSKEINADQSKYYGKYELVKRIYADYSFRQSDFGNFELLLARIVSVIEHYQKIRQFSISQFRKSRIKSGIKS